MAHRWRPLRRLDVPRAIITHVVFRPDGGALLATYTVADDDNPRLIEWDARTWRSRPVAALRRAGDWRGVYDARGKIVSQDPTVLADTLLSRLRRGGALAIVASPDGKRIAAGERDYVEVYTAPPRRLERTLAVDGRVHALAFSADGGEIAAVGQDAAVRVWRVADGTLLARLDGMKDQGWAVAFSADGRLLAAGGADGAVRLWTR